MDLSCRMLSSHHMYWRQQKTKMSIPFILLLLHSMLTINTILIWSKIQTAPSTLFLAPQFRLHTYPPISREDTLQSWSLIMDVILYLTKCKWKKEFCGRLFHNKQPSKYEELFYEHLNKASQTYLLILAVSCGSEACCQEEKQQPRRMHFHAFTSRTLSTKGVAIEAAISVR